MQVRLGVEMSGVRLQAAGSRAGSFSFCLCHLGEIRAELNPLKPSPCLGAWVLLPTFFTGQGTWSLFFVFFFLGFWGWERGCWRGRGGKGVRDRPAGDSPSSSP